MRVIFKSNACEVTRNSGGSRYTHTHTHTHNERARIEKKEKERQLKTLFIFQTLFVNRFSPIYPTSLNVKQKVTERRRIIDERGSKEEESTRIF